MAQTFLPESLVQALDTKAKVDVVLMEWWHRVLAGDETFSESDLRGNVERCERAMQTVRASLLSQPPGADLQAGQRS